MKYETIKQYASKGDYVLIHTNAPAEPFYEGKVKKLTEEYLELDSQDINSTLRIKSIPSDLKMKTSIIGLESIVVISVR